MKKKVVLAIAVFSVVALFSAVKTNAAPISEGADKEADSATEVVADLNISRFSTEKKGPNDFEITYSLVNDGRALADIMVRLRLISNDERDGMIVEDELVGKQAVSLESGTSIEQKIRYGAPKYLNGDFEIWLEAGDSHGMVLAAMKIDEIKLERGAAAPNVSVDNCYLSVAGDEKEYGLGRGVDIDKDENASVHCMVTNGGTESIRLQSVFRTTKRSTFGNEVRTPSVDSPAFDLSAGEKKDFGWTIPKPEEPQAYDLMISLVDQARQEVTGPIVAHYVLRGESATINSFQLDKTSYSKGEVAKAFLMWSPSADSFSGARKEATPIDGPALNLVIKDGSGADCVSPIAGKSLDVSVWQLDLGMPVLKNCTSMKAAVSIVDRSGKVLTSRNWDFSAPGKSVPQAQKQTQQREKKEVGLAVLFFMGLSLLAVILAVTVGIARGNKDKTKNKNKIVRVTSFLFVMLSGMLFLGTQGTSAASMSWMGASANFSINGSEFRKGDRVYACASHAVNICNNEARVNTWINGSNITSDYHRDGKGGRWVSNGSGCLDLPSDCGEHSVAYVAEFFHWDNSGNVLGDGGRKGPVYDRYVVNCVQCETPTKWGDCDVENNIQKAIETKTIWVGSADDPLCELERKCNGECSPDPIDQASDPETMSKNITSKISEQYCEVGELKIEKVGDDGWYFICDGEELGGGTQAFCPVCYGLKPSIANIQACQKEGFIDPVLVASPLGNTLSVMRNAVSGCSDLTGNFGNCEYVCRPGFGLIEEYDEEAVTVTYKCVACGPWSACSRACGGGTRTRECGERTLTESCNTQPCGEGWREE